MALSVDACANMRHIRAAKIIEAVQTQARTFSCGHFRNKNQWDKTEKNSIHWINRATTKIKQSAMPLMLFSGIESRGRTCIDKKYRHRKSLLLFLLFSFCCDNKQLICPLFHIEPVSRGMRNRTYVPTAAHSFL